MNDLITIGRATGQALSHGVDIYHADTDVIELRRAVLDPISTAKI
jgi:hypothetical protein